MTEHPMTEATPLASEQITQKEAISALRDLLVIAGTPITERQEAVFKRARAVVAAGAAPARGTLIPVTDAKGFITLHEPDEDGKPGDLVASVWRDDWLAALSASPAPSGQGVSVPEGMKAWAGGDNAPDDWDGGPTWFRMGRISERGEGPIADLNGKWCGIGNWQHNNGRWDVIAYTPKPAPAPSCAPGEVERFVIRRNGAFFRPNAAGYTNHVVAAGFYSREEADSYASIEGVTIEPLERYRADAERTIAEAKRFLAALSLQGLDAKEGGE